MFSMNSFPLTHSVDRVRLFKYGQSIFELSESETAIMNIHLEFALKIQLAYSEYCKPLCREIHMPQTAFDILMFLANNPEYKTARDIVEIRGIKANLVSVNVDKLVKEGYLTRRSVEGDRRKIELHYTEQALPIVEKGRKLQKNFEQALFQDTDEADRNGFFRTMESIEENLEHLSHENP